MIAGVALVTALGHLYANSFSTTSELWTSALHFGTFGLLGALMFPVKKKGGKLTLIADLTAGLLALASAVYLILGEQALYDRGQTFIWTDWVFASLAIVLALEFARRTAGLIIPVLSVLALAYALGAGANIPGAFQFPGLSAETIFTRAFYGGDGLFGSIAQISWSYVFMFVLFGAFLMASGAGTFILNLAQIAAGRVTGGAGFVAVMGSGLMGSVSGSAVGNTVSTGVLTIPMMTRAGLTPRFAAGVEAAASTGGQLMPPIMGAGAFIMANITGVSYLTIIAAATLPALLYFLSVALYVRVEAKRLNLTPVETPDQPKAKDVLRAGWPFILPIGVLVALLAYGFTPTWAAGAAILTTIAASYLTPTPMHPKDVIETLIQGSKNACTTALLLIAIGLVVMVVTTTGAGNTFSLMVTTWGGGNLALTLLLVAVASLVLGMGLPVTASYVILATLTAPALTQMITELRLIDALAGQPLPDAARVMAMLAVPDLGDGPLTRADAVALLSALPSDLASLIGQQVLSPEAVAAALLSAHMIIFWLSQDSNVTPPVCLCAFAAAGIAKTPPMATGVTAWKIAKGLYVIPFVMAFYPLIGGDWIALLEAGLASLLCLYALSGVFQGHLEKPLSAIGRGVCLVSAAAAVWPSSGWTGVGIAALGLAVAMTILRPKRAVIS